MANGTRGPQRRPLPEARIVRPVLRDRESCGGLLRAWVTLPAEGTETGRSPFRRDLRHRYAAGMGVSAYILIQTEVGRASGVVQGIRGLPGVVAADDVTGPYDVIVRAEAPSLDDLGRMVVSQIQAVDGITRTFTCPVVNL